MIWAEGLLLLVCWGYDWNEMNPSMIFYDGWWTDLWGMMETYGRGDPYEMSKTMGEDSL